MRISNMFSKSDSASNSPPSYELSESQGLGLLGAKASGVSWLCSENKKRTLHKLSTVFLLCSTIALFVCYTVLLVKYSALFSHSNKPCYCNAHPKIPSNATSSFGQFTFFIPRDFGGLHDGEAIVWKNGYLYNSDVATANDATIWSFEQTNITNTWYIYTRDMKGEKQWLGENAGYLMATNNMAQRKAAKMTLKHSASENTRSTILWDDKCLTISVYGAHRMDTQTKCDEYELRPKK